MERKSSGVFGGLFFCVAMAQELFSFSFSFQIWRAPLTMCLMLSSRKKSPAAFAMRRRVFSILLLLSYFWKRLAASSQHRPAESAKKILRQSSCVNAYALGPWRTLSQSALEASELMSCTRMILCISANFTRDLLVYCAFCFIFEEL